MFCVPSEHDFQEYLWKKGRRVEREEEEAEVLWWQMCPAQKRSQRWPQEPVQRRDFLETWLDKSLRENSLTSKMDLRMITYPLCCLLWSCLSSSFFLLLLLLPSKYLLGAYCMQTSEQAGKGERDDWEKPWKTRSDSGSKSADDKTEKEFSCY